MRLPRPIRLALWRACLLRVAAKRDPDFVIGGNESPYLRRWYLLPRNRFFNVYLHHFLRSDDDRALHDHPWWNCSIVLAGSYREHTIAAGGVHVRTLREEGDVVMRRATAAHRVELLERHAYSAFARSIELPTWTLFLTGPRLREWGFHCPAGWRHWREFTNADDGGRTVGRGCE